MAFRKALALGRRRRGFWPIQFLVYGLLSTGLSFAESSPALDSIVLRPGASSVEQKAADDLRAFLTGHYGMAVAVSSSGENGKPAGRARVQLELNTELSGTPDPDGNAPEAFTVIGGQDGVTITGNKPAALLQGVFCFEDWLGSGEPRELVGLKIQKKARFPFRVTMPYFTEAGKVTDAYLRSAAYAGYNAIYIGFHPFKKYIDDPVFFPISHIFRIRDFVNAPDKDAVVNYVNGVFGRAKSYGMDGYLYVMEPWGGDKAFVEAHPAAAGHTTQQKLTQPLCMGSPEAIEYLRNLTAETVRGIPELKGIIVMNEDGTTICDDSCPRCKGARSQRRATLFKTLAEGGRSVREDFRVIAYTWWWEAKDFATVIPQLPKGSLLCTRTSTNAPFALDSYWNGTPGDVSLLVDGPGQDFRDAVKYGQERRVPVLDMLAVSNGHELITMPFMPAPDRYARKLDVLQKAGGMGWVTYDCGGFTENTPSRIMRKALWDSDGTLEALLRETAADVYGPEGAEKAVNGWNACSAALRWFPVEIDKTKDSGSRQGPSMTAFAPAVPLTVRDARVYEEGDVPGGSWQQFRKDSATVFRYFPRICAGLESGSRLLEEAAQAASKEKKESALSDLRITQACLYSFRSGLNLEFFWQQLALAKDARDEQSRAAITKSILDTVAQERENTQRMLELLAQEDRLFYCACTKQFHPLYLYPGFLKSGFYTDSMSIAAILQKKIESIDTEDFRSELQKVFPKG